MERNQWSIIYTIFVFIMLAAFDNIIIGLFPPLFSLIAKDLKIQVSALGIVSAINILVTALSSVVWGYLSGKYNRKKLIMIGTVIWSISVFFTSVSYNYLELLLSQFFTGIGLGCISSIGFSVLTDYIPKKRRGMLLSLWGMSQGFGGIIGALMASLISTASNWRMPFKIVSIIGILLIFLYIFVKEPEMGEAEPELKGMLKDGSNYDYNIKFDQIPGIISKKSNVLLILQGFFMSISTGSLIWLPNLYISKIRYEGYALNSAIIAAGYLYGILQLGGLTSAAFGYIGDLFQKKSDKGRASFISVVVFTTMPFYILMFIVPMKNLYLNTSTTYTILLSIVSQMFLNPWMLLIFVLAFFASSAQSSNTPTSLAILTDVNLPEHRGTAFSILNLVSSFGRTIGNVGTGYLLQFISSYKAEPYNYMLTISILQAFFVPAAVCYKKMAKKNIEDIKSVKNTLKERTKV
ncbi:MAG: MFS transporter [Clostridium sp.]|nr:MFS transporter [Clostridium sp.]